MVTNIVTKVAQTYCDLMGSFENQHGQLLEKFGLIFISTSGHTELAIHYLLTKFPKDEGDEDNSETDLINLYKSNFT